MPPALLRLVFCPLQIAADFPCYERYVIQRMSKYSLQHCYTEFIFVYRYTKANPVESPHRSSSNEHLSRIRTCLVIMITCSKSVFFLQGEGRLIYNGLRILTHRLFTWMDATPSSTGISLLLHARLHSSILGTVNRTA